MKRIAFYALVIALALCFTMVGRTPVLSAPIEIRYATYLSPNHHLVRNVYSRWAEEVGKRTGGRVKVTLYPAGALGKAVDHYDMAAKGVADVSSTVVAFTPGRYPLSTVLELAFYGDHVKGTRAVNEIFWKDLYQEFNDVKMLFIWNPPQDIGSNKPIRTLEDMKGLKIRATGSVQVKMVEVLGATAVSMPITDVYTSVERGVVDGYMLIIGSWPGYKLDEVTKYGLKIGMSCPANVAVMNLKTWNRFPPDIQKIIEQVNVDAIGWLLDTYSAEGETTAQLLKKTGVQVYTLPPAELARWKQRVRPLWDEWLADMKAKGLPGQKVRDDFVQVLKKYDLDPHL
jgi:TRAP-type transport system periplasmic protein